MMRLAQKESQPNQLPTRFSEIMAMDLQMTQVVENLLPSGSLTLLVADGGTGKSSFIYRMADALTRGEKFADGFKTEQSNVLICQSDENIVNAQIKWKRMGIEPNEDRWEMWWDFSSSMLPDLEKRVVEEGWGVVLMDSLLKIVSEAGLSMNDPLVAEFLYDLNAMAGRTGCAVLLTHHVNGGDKKEKGIRRLNRKDIFGSTYFFNGCSQCLLAWKEADGEVAIKIDKDRNDALGEGTILEFNTCAEDYSWQLRGIAGSTIRLDELQGAAEKVRAVLSSVDSEGALSAAAIAL